MKKLLLPIIAISLMGCSQDNVGWTKVTTRGITVVFSDHTFGYSTDQYESLYYTYQKGETFSVQVKYRYDIKDSYKVDKFHGTNLTFIVWG